MRSAAMKTCKLCAGPVSHQFSMTVRQRHKADYFLCGTCGSLQISEPTWLDEAYAAESWAADTGLVARNLELACRINGFLSASCNAKDLIVDFGGGTGLLTRLLRDMGWSVLCHDPYHKPLFVDAFHIRTVEGLNPRAIIASEVFEHFEDPRGSLLTLLRSAPIIIFTTELYTGQGQNWPYLSTDSGQHIFFFSPQAIQLVAQLNGFLTFSAGMLKYLINESVVDTPAAKERLHAAITASANVEAGLHGFARYLRNPYLHVSTDHPLELEHFHKTESNTKTAA